MLKEIFIQHFSQICRVLGKKFIKFCLQIWGIIFWDNVSKNLNKIWKNCVQECIYEHFWQAKVKIRYYEAREVVNLSLHQH